MIIVARSLTLYRAPCEENDQTTAISLGFDIPGFAVFRKLLQTKHVIDVEIRVRIGFVIDFRSVRFLRLLPIFRIHGDLMHALGLRLRQIRVYALLEQHACVARGDETAADEHAMPVAHAELIVCIHAVHRLLNRIRQRRNAGDALRPEHAARDLGELVGRHHALSTNSR